ncbi:MAG TPA: type I methionyl aminopeptidase [Gemmatimonadaceae bacterium]|nr:type I methionyl aminopeptidase [Gemmatimonadaceae bacterium]
MIQLKSPREIEVMAEGGRILANTVELLRGRARAGMTTLDLDTLAEAFIRSHEGATPAFKGLYGFPGSVCTSINHEIVHGIPSKKRVLQDGDLVSIDIGVRYRGFYTDSATTVAIGEVDETSQRLLDVTQRALAAGIAAATLGNHIGDIGAAVQEVVEREGFSVVRDLVGHGIGTDFHEEPEVPNYGKPKRLMKLAPGLTIAIEPMVNVGSPRTRTLPDRWTIVTVDGSRSAHFEHTVAITENGPRVLTRATA